MTQPISQVIPANSITVTTGQINPPWEITLATDSVQTPYKNLTGVSPSQLSLNFYNASHGLIGVSNSTAWMILSTNPGIVSYTPDSTDYTLLTAPGVYYGKVVVNFNNTAPYMSRYFAITVEA